MGDAAILATDRRPHSLCTPPVPTAEGVCAAVGLSCATCEHRVPGHRGEWACNFSGAQVWVNTPKPPGTPGVNEGLANRRDEQRLSHKYGLDTDRLRCPLTMPLGNTKAMSPQQIIGVLAVAAERGKLSSLLAHYGDAERAYLGDLFAEWIEHQPTQRRLRLNEQARERYAARAPGRRARAKKQAA